MNDPGFYRSTNRLLGGVCAGLAERFHVDVLWVRVAFLIFVFLQGVGLFVYVVLWLVMPERLEGGGQRSGFDAMTTDLRRIWAEIQAQLSGTPRPASSPPGGPPPPSTDPTPLAPAAAAAGAQPSSGSRNQLSVFGLILVVIGVALLGSNIGIINWAIVWPAALITVGIVVLVRNLERRP